MVEVAAGVGQLGIGQQALERTGLGGLTQHAVDLGGVGVARGLQGDVQAGHVHRRHADGLGLDAPGQLRQQALDAAGQTGGHRNHRLEGRARTAQVFMVVGIDNRLIVHRRVNGGNGDVFQTHRLVEKFQQRHAAVGGAGGVGHQQLAAAQAGLVDPVDHRGVDIRLAGHGLRQQQTRRPGVDETLRLGTGDVLAGAFQQQIDIQCRPVDGLGLALAQHLHAVAVDVQTVAVHLHLTGKAPVGGVETGQVFDAGLIGQVVQRDDFQARPGAALVQRAQHAATDAAIAIEGDAVGTVGHGVSQVRSSTPRPLAGESWGEGRRQPQPSSRPPPASGRGATRHQASSSSSAVTTMFSTVKPKCSNSAGAGADSPKLVMPMMRPSRPTYLYQ